MIIRHTDKHLGLIISLFCSDKLTNKRTDGQTLPNALSPCFAKTTRSMITECMRRHPWLWSPSIPCGVYPLDLTEKTEKTPVDKVSNVSFTVAGALLLGSPGENVTKLGTILPLSSRGLSQSEGERTCFFFHQANRFSFQDLDY